MSIEVVDGGDRGCGELLMVLAARSRTLDPGSTVRLLATDPAAPIDLPAWCRLTGHAYLGPGRTAEGRPYFDLQLAGGSPGSPTAEPGRLDPDPSRNHPREETP